LGRGDERKQVRQKPTRQNAQRIYQKHATEHAGRKPGGALMTQQNDRSSQVAVNLPELLVRIDNDRDLLLELIDIFKEEFPRLFQQLQEHVVRGDMKSVEKTCHGLRGMLSGLSANHGATIAARLEQMGRDRDSSGLNDAVALLDREYKKLLPELDAFATKAES
jgi:HPt (histidine-containing phosphotransfer) domain-containing protein